MLAALTSAGFITVTGTPAAGQSVVILTGAEVHRRVGGRQGRRRRRTWPNQLAQNPASPVWCVAGRTGSEE